VLYGLAVVLLAGHVGAQSLRLQTPVPAALVLAGMVLWTLFEYLLHRFLFHGPQPFRRLHALHHTHPTALICSPTWLTAVLFVALVYAPARALGTPLNAAALTLGVLAGYLAYSIAHHAVHHWRGEGRWLVDRKRWHARHHREQDSRVCFGVTSGLWDRACRTAGLAARPAARPG